MSPGNSTRRTRIERELRVSAKQKGRLPTRAVIHVVCEDSRSAPKYFDAVQATAGIKSVSFRVHSSRGRSAPQQVLETAREVLRTITPPEKEEHGEGDRDSVYAMCDFDAEHHRQNAVAAERKRAANAGIRLLVSKPCFEVWILAHLEFTGMHFQDCRAVVEKVRYKWSEVLDSAGLFEKVSADYTKITTRDRIKQAIRNARKCNPESNQSWTEVYKIFEEIEEFKDAPAALPPPPTRSTPDTAAPDPS